MLSRRALVYGEEQMIFKCREHTIHDDGRYAIHGRGGREHYDLSTNSLAGQGATKDRLLGQCCQITLFYSFQGIFDLTDNFATIAGIAL